MYYLYEDMIHYDTKYTYHSRMNVMNTVDLKGNGTMFTVERINIRSGEEMFCPNSKCGRVFCHTFFVAFSSDRSEAYCKYCNPNPRLPAQLN
jgi:hypothetical protein